MEKQKPGPVPGPKTVQATILIEPELVQWGKNQPGGLSALVRKLLKQAQCVKTTARYGLQIEHETETSVIEELEQMRKQVAEDLGKWRDEK